MDWDCSGAGLAYLVDMPTPFKSILTPSTRAELKQIDARLTAAIGLAFGVDLSHDDAVKR